jgi:predicted tellurium resistance membrane protein TerC
MINHLRAPVVTIGDFAVSWRDIILLSGGLFLMYKATTEIHATVQGHHEDERKIKHAGFIATIAQIAVIDVVFALDSMITAIGMTDVLWVMIFANVVAIIIMLYFSEKVAAFIERFPTVKMLALSFLMLIGVVLVADGMHFHIPKQYVYFAIAFSLGTEALNLVTQSKKDKRSKTADE